MNPWDMLDDRELAFMVLDNENHDYDAQLRAIHELLTLRRRDARAFGARVRDLERFAAAATGTVAERAVDETVEHYHHSVYRDAAQSMAAVGMLAPFVETLFVHGFQGVEKQAAAHALSMPAHPRWALKPKRRWDCHFDQTGGKNIVGGILDLAEAIDLAWELPSDLRATLAALFRYRNAMFHQGFEWTPDERAEFAADKAEWPAGWFTMSTSGGEPWIYYATDSFVDHVLKTVELTLVGFGHYVRRTF
jgi:hypothetical protein